MKNDLIKSVYDLEEKSESIGRRDFIKKAGIAGLALAGLGSLGGCASGKFMGLDYNRYDFNQIAQRYKDAPISVNKMEDFLLSEEELGTMTLTWPFDRVRLGRFDSNPLKGDSQKYSFQNEFRTPSCTKWLLAEYIGKTHYPLYNFNILINKFATEKDFFVGEEKIKKWFLERESIHREIQESVASSKKRKLSIERLKEWHTKRKPCYGEYIFFSKYPFISKIETGLFLDKEHKYEHISRVNLYQAKRGLKTVWSDF